MQLTIFSKGFLQKLMIAALATGTIVAPALIASPAAHADSSAAATFAAQIANMSYKLTTNPAFSPIANKFTGYTNSPSFDWNQVMFQTESLSSTQVNTKTAIQPDIQNLLSFSATTTPTALSLINDVISKMQNLNPDITSDQALGFLQALEQQSMNNMLPLISQQFQSSDVVSALQNAMTASLSSSSSTVQGIFSASGPYPVVTGVVNGQSFDPTGATPQFNGTGTLDGQSFSSGTLVTSLGSHTLTVTNSIGHATIIQFTIAKPVAGGGSAGGSLPSSGSGAGSTGNNLGSGSGIGNSSGSGSTSQNGGAPVISIPIVEVGKGFIRTAIDATSSLSSSTTQTGLVSATVDANQLIQLAQAASNGSGSANNGLALVVDLTAKSASAMGGTITVPLKGIAGIQSLNANNSLAVKTTEGSFNLPVSTLSTSNLSGLLGVDSNALDQNQTQVSIQIQPASAAVQASAVQAAGNSGDTLAAPVVDFSVTVSSNGKSASLTNFGSAFVAHSIPVSSTIDRAHAVAVHVKVNQDVNGNVTGTELDPVPTQFASGSVTALTNHDSSYSVVVTNKSFADIDSSWAKQDILSLANKLIVKGIDPQNYGPGQNVTRAELAAMIVRALGLDSVQTTDFSDVASGDWFAGAVGAAVKAGVINGEGDGAFHPNDNVSRQDAAVMIDRALHYAGIKDSGSLAAVNNFADSGSISSYAQTAIASMIDDGIFSPNGYGDGQVHPNDATTREQMAKMILKFMEKGNLIAE